MSYPQGVIITQDQLNRLSTAYSAGYKQQTGALLTQVSNKEITDKQHKYAQRALDKFYKEAWGRIKNNSLNQYERKLIRDANYKATLDRMASTTQAAVLATAEAKRYASEVKAYTSKAKEYTEAVAAQTAAPKWTITHPVTGEVTKFHTRSEADKLAKSIQKEQQALADERAATMTKNAAARRQYWAAQTPQFKAAQDLEKQGLIERTEEDGVVSYKLTGSLTDLSKADIRKAKVMGFDIPAGATGKKEDKRDPIIKATQYAIEVIGTAWESIFTSVTDPIHKTAEKSLKASVSKALAGKPVKGFAAYAVGTTLRAAGGAIDIVTFPVRPESWAGAAEAVGLMLMPEKGETQAEYKSRLSDMVKNDVYDPQQRAQMEKLLLSTMPPTPLSSGDIEAGKEFRKAVAESIIADPVGFLAEVAGGFVGAQLLSSACGRLTSKMRTEISDARYLENLKNHPWSGGTATVQEFEWMNQVVEDSS